MITRIGWLFHNIVAHPVAGILWVLGFEMLGDLVHDTLMPRSEEP